MPSPPDEPPPLDETREPDGRPADGALDGEAAHRTYERALGLLSARSRSVKQLEKRLIEKGEPKPAVTAAIARLSAAGLLDDARFAAVRARGQVGKARSTRRMAQTLAHDGVARDVAQSAIQQALDEEGTSELALAEQAARKKMRGLSRLDPVAQRNKLYGFLARQGYGAEVVRRTLRAVIDASVPDEEEPGAGPEDG